MAWIRAVLVLSAGVVVVLLCWAFYGAVVLVDNALLFVGSAAEGER